MNIKSISPNPVVPLDSKQRISGEVRTQSSTERDANGRQEHAEQEQKRHLTQQEFDDAMKTLSEHPGLKSNSLVIKVESHEDHRVILIVDSNGQIVRRLSENQLWLATRDKDRRTGRILDKAM